MEIKFQKTLGKFITKTKVVKLNREKPNPSDIINRTICRFIPFDGISYLFVKNGLHDYLSKTKVIKG
ncbi:RDD family protein [Bizionia sp.]|uniref:RDD family protein n=1 Tax=Bizionia sp. TaxID=1954480 RepID=UPI003A94611E